MTDKELIELTIDNYATYADTRQTQKQAALFEEDGGMTVYYPWNDPNQPELVNTPDKLMKTFEDLKQYDHTFHFIGQKEISLSDNANQASAYVYTIAHHVSTDENGARSLMVAYLRYNDTLRKQEDGQWLFVNRDLHADFIENRELK